MTDKEYIERGALIAFVSKVRKNLPKDSKDFFTRDEMLLNFQQYVDWQPAADVEPVVRDVSGLIDVIFSHNSIIALYEEHPEEEGRPMYEVWRGMAHELPKQYKQRKFVRIFGSIPQSIVCADTINILVERGSHMMERSGSGE